MTLTLTLAPPWPSITVLIPQVYLSNCSLTAVDRTAFTSLALMIELDLSNNKVFIEPIELMLELKLSRIILASLERMSLSIEYPIKYPIQYPNLTRPRVSHNKVPSTVSLERMFQFNAYYWPWDILLFVVQTQCFVPHCNNIQTLNI